MCPPCQWAWPSLPGSEAVQQLARERVGCAVYGLGFRLRPDTHRVSLTSATRAARQSALRGAFGLREDCRTALPERVVLVDDVLTTGATFRACQQVFGAEGVEVVGGVWLAMG